MNPQAPVAIITGAGTGIGHACVSELAHLGWRVVLVGRTAETLDEAASLCEPGSSLVVVADVADASADDRIVAATLDAFGRIDALVNNAGYALYKPFYECTDEELDRTFQVNAIGPLRLMVRAWHHLSQSKGRIVNVSSYATLDPFSGLGVYGAAKAALNIVGKASAQEGREFGVRVFTVAPGAVETGMLRAIWSEDQLPREHTLAPDEIASVIVGCVVGRRDHEAGGLIPLASP